MEASPKALEAPGRVLQSSDPAVNYDQRLSSPSAVRIPAITSVSFFTGLMLGLSQGSTMAGLRFRAENSHRFPTSATGWYLYHKSKNYHKMLGGLKEGFRMGGKVAFWGGSFFAFEELVDSARGTKDFISTLVAGLSVAGGFSIWNRFPVTTAARTAKTGLIGSLVYGLAQDGLRLAKGQRLAYVDFLTGRSRTVSVYDSV